MQSTSVLPSQSAWRVGLRWLAGAFVAWLIGLFLLFSIGWNLGSALTSMLGVYVASVLAFGVGGMVCGAILGFGAWVALQHRAGSLRTWVLASATSFAFGAPVGATLMWLQDNLFAVLLTGAVMGVFLGAAQWIALQQFARAGWWIATNVLGVAAAFWCGSALGGEGREGVAMLASSAAYAVITAGALVGILAGKGSMARAHPVRVP